MLNSALDDEDKVIGNTIFIYLASFSRFTGARRCVRREQWHVMSIEFAYDDEKGEREREKWYFLGNTYGIMDGIQAHFERKFSQNKLKDAKICYLNKTDWIFTKKKEETK